MDDAFACTKSGSRGETVYSVSLDHGGTDKGRMTLYKWNGPNYKSISWNDATLDDFESFDIESPDTWFETAAYIIKEKVV